MEYPLSTLFAQFQKERTYLKNVAPRTLDWYRVAFDNYRLALGQHSMSLPTKATLQQFVYSLKKRGLRVVTINTYIGAMNAFATGCIRKATSLTDSGCQNSEQNRE